MNQIPRLAFGTAALGLPGYGLHTSHKTTHTEAVAMLEHASSRGVRWFDLGAAYGDAEDIWCAANTAFDAKAVTKLAPELPAFGVGRDGDTYHAVLLHNPTLDDLSARGLMDCFREACEEWSGCGARPKLGASVYTPAEASAALALGLRCGVAFLQIPYHALDQRHAKAGIFEAARAAGVKVMARQPWARGLLLINPCHVGARVLDATGDIDRASDACESVDRYQAICARHGLSPLEAGLRFSLKSTAGLIVFGCSSIAQLREVLDIAEADPPAAWPECYAELLTTFADSGLTLGSVCTPGR